MPKDASMKIEISVLFFHAGIGNLDLVIEDCKHCYHLGTSALLGSIHVYARHVVIFINMQEL